MTAKSQTVDKDEIERFSRIAEEWWDEKGKFRPLHLINPVRLGYIRDKVCAHFNRNSGERQSLQGLSVIDIGCGGGLLCEPLTRLGAEVTGIDAADRNIKVAALHAENMGLNIQYLATTPEAFVASGQWPVASKEKNTDHRPQTTDHSFDIVLALEIVEHVADVPAFLQAVTKLVKPGGILFMSTLSRTAKSYALAIIGAEYVLRWLPRGTHTWQKFLKPSELCAGLRQVGMQIDHMTGMTFNPFSGAWALDDNDLSVNYLLTSTKA